MRRSFCSVALVSAVLLTNAGAGEGIKIIGVEDSPAPQTVRPNVTGPTRGEKTRATLGLAIDAAGAVYDGVVSNNPATLILAAPIKAAKGAYDDVNEQRDYNVILIRAAGKFYDENKAAFQAKAKNGELPISREVFVARLAGEGHWKLHEYQKHRFGMTYFSWLGYPNYPVPTVNLGPETIRKYRTNYREY